jgi:predicted nucleic acid-binding Zn ribbon protein
MSTDPCPVCGTPRPADRISDEPWCCSINCYRTFWHIPTPELPSCHDVVTTACPVCQHPFSPVGRQKFCSDACRAAAYRRRRNAGRPAVRVPIGRPRRPITVYECGSCGARAVGEQRCPDCATFMRKIGLGGECPHCGEAVAVAELLAQEVIAAD